MSGIDLSEAVIRQNANTKSWQRGEICYRDGSVVSVIRRGEEIQAEVQGSEEQPYRITIIPSEGGKLTTLCTCSYAYDGWCKHIVATTLTCIREPEIIEQRSTLPQLFERLDHPQTQRLVRELVTEHPELIDEIDGYVNAILTSSSIKTSSPKSTPFKQIAIDRKKIQSTVRQTFRDAVNSWESGYDYADETVNENILSMISDAVENCDFDDAKTALAILNAITEACVSDWDYVADYGMDNDEIALALNNAWCEGILSSELIAKERGEIEKNLKTWQEEWNADFSLAISALEQGWDYPPLLKVLSGNVSHRAIWENQEIPDYADDLALIRLKILERQEREREYLYLAQSEQQTKQYLTMLGRLGRVEEAVATAERQMSTMEEAFALAQALQQKQALSQALKIARQGLNLPGKCQYKLGIWTSELAESLGDIDAAITDRKNAFQAEPTFSDYLIIEELAGDNWEQIKLDLHQSLRQSNSFFSSMEEKVNIFLHEGLVADAINCTSELSSYNAELIYRVMDAAISVNPDWVIENSCRRAEKIMDNKKSEYYRYAVEWLKKARLAYVASGRQAEWKKYYQHLLDIHCRKRKLMELLKQSQILR